MKQNIWYHGTSDHAWKKIQKEGKLLGVHNNGRRFTFLCRNKEEAGLYGNVTLRVEYDPTLDLDNNNFTPEMFELGEIKTISEIDISKIRRI